MKSIIGKVVEFNDVFGMLIRDTVKEVIKVPNLGWIFIVMTDDKMYEIDPRAYRELLESMEE